MMPFILGGAIFAAALLILAATSNKLKCRKYFLKSDKISKKITIAQISDLHECRYGKGQEKLLSMLREASPDIIVITGDTFEDDDKTVGQCEPTNPAVVFLSGATKIAPCYMVLGNHERFIKNFDGLLSNLEAMGIRLLHNRSGEGIVTDKIKIADSELIICGAADPYFSYDSVNRRNRKIRQLIFEDKDKNGDNIKKWRYKIEKDLSSLKRGNTLSILLSHRPEEYEFYEKLGFDVVFSGHAHGGQWRLPPIINGLYAPHQGIFPPHAGGCYSLRGGLHIVSRGLSKKRLFRIFNRPEVCILEISKEI